MATMTDLGRAVLLAPLAERWMLDRAEAPARLCATLPMDLRSGQRTEQNRTGRSTSVAVEPCFGLSAAARKPKDSTMQRHVPTKGVSPSAALVWRLRSNVGSQGSELDGKPCLLHLTPKLALEVLSCVASIELGQIRSGPRSRDQPEPPSLERPHSNGSSKASSSTLAGPTSEPPFINLPWSPPPEQGEPIIVERVARRGHGRDLERACRRKYPPGVLASSKVCDVRHGAARHCEFQHWPRLDSLPCMGVSSEFAVRKQR